MGQRTVDIGDNIALYGIMADKHCMYINNVWCFALGRALSCILVHTKEIETTLQGPYGHRIEIMKCCNLV